MNLFSLATMPNYRITVECVQKPNTITVAGFTTNEESENLLCHHLRNLGVQSDGSFSNTQHLLKKLILEWQNSFCLQSTQMLHSISNIEKEYVACICLYKQENNKNEKLINKVCF